MSPRFSVMLLDEGVFTDRVLACLRAAGRVDAHVVSSTAGSVARHSRHVRSFRPVRDFCSRPDGLDLIMREIRRVRPDILLPVDFRSVVWCAKNRVALERAVSLPPIADPTLLQELDDKEALHRLLEKAGLPTPRQTGLSPGEDPREKVSGLDFPLIAKPVSGRGGRNTFVVQDSGELRAFSERQRLNPARWIVQEFVDSADWGVSMLCESGRVLVSAVQKGLGNRRSKFGPHGTFLMTSNPAITAQAALLAKSVSFSGIAQLDFVECRRTGQSFLVDFNPRYWASLLASLGAGVNFPLMMCERALGQTLAPHGDSEGLFFTDQAPLGKLLPGLLGMGGRRVRFSMTSWRWMMTDPKLQAARLKRALSRLAFSRTTWLGALGSR